MIERKLSPEQRMLVLRKYAEMAEPAEISLWIKDSFNIDYKTSSISSLVQTPTAKPVIAKFKEDWMRRVKEVPIANKRIRIEDLEYIRVKLMKLIKDNLCDSKGQKEEFRHQVKTLNEIILNAREEMEKKPFITIGLGDFSDKSDDELIAERDEILKQAERLVKGSVIEISHTPNGVENTGPIEPA